MVNVKGFIVGDKGNYVPLQEGIIQGRRTRVEVINFMEVNCNFKHYLVLFKGEDENDNGESVE